MMVGCRQIPSNRVPQLLFCDFTLKIELDPANFLEVSSIASSLTFNTESPGLPNLAFVALSTPVTCSAIVHLEI